ncbi:MAG: alcohol dehydrogenase catalytic domain-containing protein [Kiritimatiellaeota bacterium]|nr:alcohol dehydrogenase catalytic domain-containing protein [Kiritimatiellota bacterium]
MKAVLLTAKKVLEVREVPTPAAPKGHGVLLAIESVGVCGSDIHYYHDGRVGDQIITFPFAIGHECSATVLAVGPDAKRVKVGDRVAVEPAISCGVCDQCRAHRRHTCRKLLFLGCPGQLEGCLREQLVMPDENCFPLAPKTTLDQGALVEPLSISVYAASLGAPQRGQSVAVLGAGPIGLGVLMVLRQLGLENIYVSEPLEYRRQHAKNFGARHTFDSFTGDIADAWQQAEPLGFDVVYECCGQQTAIDDALHVLKPGGTLVLVGIPTVNRISLAMDYARRKEITLRNVRRQNDSVVPALKYIESGAIPMHKLQTHVFPVAQAAEAFDLVANYRDGVIKAMIRLR